MSIIQLIVFDMDGTLYETDSSFVPAVQTFIKKYDLPPPSMEYLHKLIGEPGYVFEEWIKSLKIDAPLNELFSVFDRLELNGINKWGKLYPATIQTLEQLKFRKVKMALCSNGSQRYVNKIVSKFRLDRYVAWIRTPQHRGETKSMMLADLFDAVRPDVAYMVGDRYHDIQAAKENSVVSVGAAYGYGGDEIITADHKIQSISELLTILD